MKQNILFSLFSISIIICIDSASAGDEDEKGKSVDALEQIMLEDIQVERARRRETESIRQKDNERLKIGIQRNLHPMVSVIPIYPASAIAQEIEGEVRLTFTVDEQRKPSNVEIVQSSNELFNIASIRSVKKWHYHLHDIGKNVFVTFKFTLNN